MQWDITYLRNGTLIHFFEDEDIYHPVFKVTGQTEDAVVSEVKDYISELMMENCFSVEEKQNTLRVFDPSDGETVETFADIKVQRVYSLLGTDGSTYLSCTPGTLGGHKKLKIYGRLDCPSANRHIAKGQYITHRVFFADEATAIAAGYRPCAVCMRDQYNLWKASQGKSNPLK
jgi:hypothetical protein